jgi:tetratricopeptide (TPR) repeat protein
VVDNLVLVLEEAKRRKEFGTALRVCERLVPAVKKDGRWYLVNRVLFANADALREAGRFDEARGVLEELVRGNRRERDVYAAPSYAVEVGKTLAMQGRPDKAVEVFVGALKDLHGIGDVLGASWAYDAGGRALHDAGRFRPAVEWFRKALEGFESAERHRAGILAVLPPLARSLEALGMSEEARDAIRRHDELKASPPPDDLEQAFFMEDLERRGHILASMSPGELAIRIKRDGEGWHFLDVPTSRKLDLPLRYRGRHVVFQGMDFRINGAMIAHGGYWVFLAEGQEAALTREGKFLRGK